MTAESCRYRERTRLGGVGDGGKLPTIGIPAPLGASPGPATLCPARRQEQAPARRNARELHRGLWREQPSWSQWAASTEHSARRRGSSPAPSVDARCQTPPSRSILRCFFPPGGGAPAPTSYCPRQEHPCWDSFPLLSIPQLPSALRQGSAGRWGVPLGTRAPLPLGATAVLRTL